MFVGESFAGQDDGPGKANEEFGNNRKGRC